MKNNKASAVITAIIIIVVLAVVGGVSWYVISQKQPSPSLSPSAGEEDQFKDWKTYRNEEYGYEMKYPKDWTAEHSSGYNETIGVYYESNTFTFKNSSGKYILGFGIVPKGSNIRTPNLRTGVGGIPIKTDETININGINFNITQIVTNGKITEIWVESIKIDNFNGKAEFIYLSDDPLKDFDVSGTPELSIAKKILSTFKFIDETADWKTYKNTTYGFEVKYPTDWLSKECDNVVFFDNKQLKCEPEKMIGRVSIQGGLSLTAKGSLSEIYTDSREMVNFEKKDILIDGQQAIRISGLRRTWDMNTGKEDIPNYIDVILFGEADNNFEIQYNEKNTSSQYLNIFNQILSTFKFTK